jgi:Replicase family/Primase C terminal 1 (PriCT-1)
VDSTSDGDKDKNSPLNEKLQTVTTGGLFGFMPLIADDQADRRSSLGEVGRRFCEKLMRSPRASNGNRGGVFQPPVTMAKAKALKHRLIQFNGPRYISYLVFDVDRPAAALAWQDANLPRPTLIIENPRNTFAHYAYELATPVRLENKRAANLAHAIHKAMRDALEADPDYRGNLTKSPLHPDWRAETNDHAYTLTELAEHLDLDRQSRPAKQMDLGDVSHSRNLTFREWLRFWAYANVRCYTDSSSFETGLTDQANTLNERFATNPKGRLKRYEVAKWVRSIGKWVWDRYTEGKFQSGYQGKPTRKLDLPRSLSVRERQQHGQEYTAQKRVVKTEDRIQWAIRSLIYDGCPVNKSSVARLTGLSRPTVIRHFDNAMGSVKEEQNGSVRKEVEVLPKPSAHLVPPVKLASFVLPDSPIADHVPSASQVHTLTGSVTQTDTLRGIERPNGRESLLGGYATGVGVTIDSQCYTPPAAPPDIPTYEEVRQGYDDGSPYSHVKGIVEAMKFAMFMAVEHGVLIAELPRSQQNTLTKLIAERQGITLPPPKRVKSGRPWRRPERRTEIR